MRKEIDIQKEYINGLLELVKQNPDLPILPMVDSEIVGDDGYCRWMGSWGDSYIGEYIKGREHIYYRDDDDFGEIEELLSEEYGHAAFDDMSVEMAKKAYAEMPWIKAIIVAIDLPD